MTQGELEQALRARQLAEQVSDANFQEAIARAEQIRQKELGFPRSPEAPAPRPASPAAGGSRLRSRPVSRPTTSRIHLSSGSTSGQGASAPVRTPRRRSPGKGSEAPAVRSLPHQMGEVIARQHARTARETAVTFLEISGLKEELEHFLALEERLTVGTRPAQYHAALSTRHLLKGVADSCFVAREQPVLDRFGKPHPVLIENVGNRIAAFVDERAGLSNEEHRLFIATLDTVTRWAGRGPHRIYPREARNFFIRLLDVLEVVATAYFRPTTRAV
jgi:hypothetical protein